MSISDLESIKDLLDGLVRRFNTRAFVADDPVQYARGWDDLRDAEIASLLVSTIAWGRRDMILRDGRRMIDLLDNEPYAFVAQGDIESIPDDNIHRTFFGRHLRHYLRGLRLLYSRYGSLQGMTAAIGADKSEFPAWEIARALNGIIAEANVHFPLEGPSRCIPENVDDSALKRLNMALRWLVRRDGIVDTGMWTVLDPSRLYIPLDVHSGATARALGLLTRRQNDRRAVVELTQRLRTFRPDDPVIYDFALFGAGVYKFDSKNL